MGLILQCNLYTLATNQMAKSKHARLRADSQPFDNPDADRVDTEIRGAEPGI